MSQQVPIPSLFSQDSTSGQRIRVPGRGSKCDHVDIVDVHNSTRATQSGEIEWMCPVCGMEYTNTDDIEIDGLLQGIIGDLETTDPGGEIRALNLHVDGTWTKVSDNAADRLPMRRKKRPRLTLAQATAVAGITAGPVLLDEEDSDGERGSDESTQRRTAVPSNTQVIDLDSD